MTNTAATEKAPAENTAYDWGRFATAMTYAVTRGTQILNEYLEHHSDNHNDWGDLPLDPMNMREACLKWWDHALLDPEKFATNMAGYWRDWILLWQNTARRFAGEDIPEMIQPERGDRRFRSPLWQNSLFFDFLKQSYLLAARWTQQTVHDISDMDPETQAKVDFYTKQFVDALAPSNYALTNPDVIQETIETGGDNLVRGLENLLKDLERGKGELRISTTDYSAFEVGRNLAITPGQVIYRNDLIELIQYEPAGSKVHKTPLLIVPPWINKYYILDLRPDNSLIKWMVEQGHTVFAISWVNPDARLAQKDFTAYMKEGVLAALDAVQTQTGETQVNAVGYCLGGTLLACTLAYLKQTARETPVKSATFLTTLLDFEESGDLKLFVDDAQLALLEERMAEQGYLEGDAMHRTFSLLRSNDLIWSFVVNNYLMGREPFPFDLLYWNDDSTRMPAAMHSFYLRKMYRDNALSRPDGIELGGVPIDLGKLDLPSYFLSTREDHIAPWRATYASARLLGGGVRFTLAASGHIAGVVNPPSSGKYCYWTRDDVLPATPENWVETAEQHEGSWWPHWEKWIRPHAGPKSAAPRDPGKGPLKPLCPAPGTYVKMKGL